jgi:hypothetical protein
MPAIYSILPNKAPYIQVQPLCRGLAPPNECALPGAQRQKGFKHRARAVTKQVQTTYCYYADNQQLRKQHYVPIFLIFFIREDILPSPTTVQHMAPGIGVFYSQWS